jgi:hypothetical protein
MMLTENVSEILWAPPTMVYFCLCAWYA